MVLPKTKMIIKMRRQSSQVVFVQRLRSKPWTYMSKFFFSSTPDFVANYVRIPPHRTRGQVPPHARICMGNPVQTLPITTNSHHRNQPSIMKTINTITRSITNTSTTTTPPHPPHYPAPHGIQLECTHEQQQERAPVA